MVTAPDSANRPILNVLDHMLNLLQTSALHAWDFVESALDLAKSERFVREWIAAQ